MALATASRILVVDGGDELRRLLEGNEAVSWERSSERALQRLEAERFDVVVVDQSLKDQTGTQFLERSRHLIPQTLRVLCGDATQFRALADAIRRRIAHRVLARPVTPNALTVALRDPESTLEKSLRVHVVAAGQREIADNIVRALATVTDISASIGADETSFADADVVLLVRPKVRDLERVHLQLGGERRRIALISAVQSGADDDLTVLYEAGADVVLAERATAPELELQCRGARARRSAMEEEAALRQQLHDNHGFHGLVGVSQPMREIFGMVSRVARSDATVLVTGESGTGKELVARALHAASPRRAGPFVGVNLSALPETLVEAELFGHESGAFTGATGARVGRIEKASGGTLFLDEIGDLSASVQVKLLRVLQSREFERLGSTVARPSDFRLVCATHRDLEARVQEGSFREDLFYRLNVVRLHVPPLRERMEDLPLLVDCFLSQACVAAGLKGITVQDAAFKELMEHNWPGNVRELEHAIQAAVALSLPNTPIGPGIVQTRRRRASFRYLVENHSSAGRGLDEVLTDVERIMIEEALVRCGGNLTAAARKLKLARQTLQSRMKRHGL